MRVLCWWGSHPQQLSENRTWADLSWNEGLQRQVSSGGRGDFGKFQCMLFLANDQIYIFMILFFFTAQTPKHKHHWATAYRVTNQPLYDPLSNMQESGKKKKKTPLTSGESGTCLFSSSCPFILHRDAQSVVRWPLRVCKLPVRRMRNKKKNVIAVWSAFQVGFFFHTIKTCQEIFSFNLKSNAAWRRRHICSAASTKAQLL